VLNAHEWNMALENFQGTYWESNPEPPVLCRSAMCMYIYIYIYIYSTEYDRDSCTMKNRPTVTMQCIAVRDFAWLDHNAVKLSWLKEFVKL
jgi:hypothetical protein